VGFFLYFAGMEILFSSLNIIGMLCELIGLIMVYQIKIKKFYQIPMINFNERATFGGETSPREMIRNLKEDMNYEAENVNRQIEKDDRKATKYFYLISLGFGFQLSSTVFSFCHLVSKDSTTKREAKKCEARQDHKFNGHQTSVLVLYR
jgi:hypothetical protein